ncbi:hypothetical protein GGS20DRAFT_195400 [Poronia punctata]|nr:hypothetical protein GGS20DRAFT_195400 [Poronia punctata]
MAQEQNQTILPKGIVLNRNAIYEEIARYDVIPVEQILRACHVFSTTSRKLYDPTARRLQNFWTRMLGGDRRYLSGKIVARLFKDISEETAFVKLRGPANRYEPPSPASSQPHNIPVESATPASKSKGDSVTSSGKVLHPILKKPRGPSASGPRPTARFVSPEASELDEDNAKKSGTTTPTPAPTNDDGSKNLGKPSTKEEKRKVMNVRPKKKTTAFAASTSSRRRPAMPRRTSSQSSAANSDTGSKDGDSSVGSRHDGLHGLVPTTIPEKPEKQSAGKKKGKGKGKEKETTNQSAKAAGKRPATQPHVEATAARVGPSQTGRIQGSTIGTSGGDKAKAEHPSSSTEPEKVGKKEESSKSREAAAETNVENRNPHGDSNPNRPTAMKIKPPVPGLSRQNSREASRAIMPPSSLTSSSLAAVDTSVVGQGTISAFMDRAPSQVISGGQLSGGLSGSFEADTAAQTAGSSSLPQRFAPTQPANTAPIPLGRTKSQLSLLLDQKRPKQR